MVSCYSVDHRADKGRDGPHGKDSDRNAIEIVRGQL